MLKNRTLIAAIFVTITIIFAAHTIQAAGPLPYQQLAPLPGLTDAEASDLPLYLMAMFKLLIGIAAALAVIMITIGGVQYMSTDAIGDKSEGKEKIKNALTGLILAIVSWLILYTINPDLVKFNLLVPPPVTLAPGSAGSTTPLTAPPPGVRMFHKVLTCYPVQNASSTNQTPIRMAMITFPYGGDTGIGDRTAYNNCMNTPPPPVPSRLQCATVVYSCDSRIP